MDANELKREIDYRKLLSVNNELRSKLNSANFQNTMLRKKQEGIIKKEVELRTKKLNDELKDKDKQIEVLKRELARMSAKLNNDSTNSGLPTSMTPINKKKHIPNTREKSEKDKGGQKGHPKHKLKKFNEEELTEIVDVNMKECPKCGSKNIEALNTYEEKDETDYDVKIIKRRYKFNNYKCNKCGYEFHSNIPNSLKEENQYGTTVQSLAVCLTNEIYTPFNKTVKLISGITYGEINISEGYVAKLQKRAYKYLEQFTNDLKKYFPKQPVYGWDDGVIMVNKKQGILRVYCTENVVLTLAHTNKNEASLDEDNILLKTPRTTIVMHDHIIHNYNEKYSFENVECLIHLIRRIRKIYEEANHHKWCEELIKILSETNKERNKLISQKEEKFNKEYIEKLSRRYDEIVEEGVLENEEDTNNYEFEKEIKFLNDIKKYKKNYLLWAYDFRLPSTNNECERAIRPVKSKLKICGQFQSIEYANYYATIRSYIETCKKNGINIINACSKLMLGEPYTLEEIIKIGKENSQNEN